MTPSPTLLRAGARRVATAVLLPPVPDGGPLRSCWTPTVVRTRVCRHARSAHFVIEVVRRSGLRRCRRRRVGTPGRGTEWERLHPARPREPVLEDQVNALHAAADEPPARPRARAIRGGASAESRRARRLRRPDVFHAALAGAPVTDWRLYDTHYTQRYLGDPVDADVYDASSLLPRPRPYPAAAVHPRSRRRQRRRGPTLQLSSALLAAGRPQRCCRSSASPT